jgi:hypothetical protein
MTRRSSATEREPAQLPLQVVQVPVLEEPVQLEREVERLLPSAELLPSPEFLP